MPTADYTTIKNAIEDESTATPSQALKGTYMGDPPGSSRKFLAYALGDGRTGGASVEVVLGWQYEGYHTDPDPTKNWRCFQVGKFTGAVGSKITSIAYASALTPPGKLTPEGRARQNCVVRGIMGPRVYREATYHT